MRFSTLSGLITAAAISVQAIPTIHSKGSKFFDSNGNQFYIKGVSYQLVPDDPLIDVTQCKLDAALMKTLGANSIRVYHVDPNGSHDACMSAFADAGIYLWLDLDTFTSQIEQPSPHWNQKQLSDFEKVMDAFHNYDNTAGFLVGNEVITTANGSVAAPFVKAAARDVKAYRNAKGYRNIPVGYAAADIASLRPMLQNYLACGTNASEAVDYYCLNAYEWCGASSYTQSGYNIITEQIHDYNVPIFFSETGCNTVPPRTWDDQAAIFGPDMAPYWSGSIIYEWIEEQNNYGIVNYGPKVDPSLAPDGYPRSGTPTPVVPDFTNLANQWKTLTPSGVKESAYNPTLTVPACPAQTSGVWEVNGNVPLPTLGQTYGAAAVGGGSATATGTGASASASATKAGGASPAKEIKGMGLGLAGVLVGFFWWM